MLRSYLLKSIILTSVAVLSFTACTFSVDVNTGSKKVKKKEIDPENLISCEGVGDVKLSDTRDSLVNKFGTKNVVDHENTVYGVFTTLFEGDARQLNIYWKEKSAPFKTIKYIEVTGSGSPYMTKDSVQLGQSLRELVKTNGGISIRFRNIYGVDEPGLIKNFNGGEIEKNNPCLTGILEQSRINTVHSSEIKEFRKKDEVDSFDPLLNRIEYELVSIRIMNKQ